MAGVGDPDASADDGMDPDEADERTPPSASPGPDDASRVADADGAELPDDDDRHDDDDRD